MSVTLRRDDCEAAVKGFINSSKFILKDYKVKPFSDKTLGFMGRHLKLNVSVLYGGKIQDLKFFAKQAPTNEIHRDFVIGYNFFNKEVYTYKHLVPLLNASLPSGVTLPVPKCYFTRDFSNKGTVPEPGSDEAEVIILEDLTSRGFTIIENFPPLDLHHCRVIVKSMATFHSASILLVQSHKQSDPNYEATKGVFSQVKESFLVHEEGHCGYDWARYSAESFATAVTKMWPERFHGKREMIFSALLKVWHRVLNMAQPSKKHMNVLCHGDIWTNNMLYRYKYHSNGEKVLEEVVLVDLQVVRYAPPILDFLLFIHVCTRRNFRDQYLKDLFKYYHSCLEEIVSSELLENVFPFSSFLESYEDLKDFGRVMSTAYIPIILDENDPCITADEPKSFDFAGIFFRDRGETIAKNCTKSRNYKEIIEDTYLECLKGLGFWED